MEENKFKIIILIVFIAITLHFIIMSLFISNIYVSYRRVKSLEHIGSEKYYKNLGVK